MKGRRASPALISIALAVHQGKRYLGEQIRSILNQDTISTIEIVAVDDASSDGSYELLQELSLSERRLKVYRNPERLGITANFLKAVSLSLGDFVLFSDQDDLWRKDKIRRLEERIRKGPDVRLVYSDLDVRNDDFTASRGSFWRIARCRPRRGRLGSKAILRNLSPGCSMMFDQVVRDRLKAIYHDPLFVQLNSAARLDDEVFMHDHLTFFIACCTGYIDYIPDRLAWYRQHYNNSVGAFYEAASGPGRVVASLERRIELIERIPALKDIADLDELKGLVSAIRGGASFMHWAYLPHFLFMRQDTAPQKALGVVQCIWPGAYDRARAWAKS